LRFLITEDSALGGTLSYVKSEHSFTYDPARSSDLAARAGGSGVTSLVIDTLQIEVGVDTGRLLFVWGYHPMGGWLHADLSSPQSAPGQVIVEVDDELEMGISIPIPGHDWLTEYDPRRGLICVRRYQSAPSHYVTIADGVTVGLSENSINDLWLQPVFED
jgi:hypothetical protein